MDYFPLWISSGLVLVSARFVLMSCGKVVDRETHDQEEKFAVSLSRGNSMPCLASLGCVEEPGIQGTQAKSIGFSEVNEVRLY